MAGKADAIDIEAIRKAAKAVSFYVCKDWGRLDLCEDIEQDLCVIILEKGQPDRLALKRDGIDLLRSKKYHYQSARCKKQYNFIPLPDLTDGEAPDEAYLIFDDGFNVIADKIDAEPLMAVFSYLPTKYRYYLWLWMQGYTTREIAARAKVTSVSVTQAKSAALRIIRQKFNSIEMKGGEEDV